ncbi:MarR family winged helix-turn-helix transcriptional regulator [Nocardioides sp. CFH 31398]|uniref:MarR family winged helix-turn-helix transcriptional regulator n=1 Tax=Nocardioides sp. CFH 31398 TaxID=2919579 RepID=UPI001F0647BE|nr:MarR family winged helix-turn-helix transcriptional regulator [Nocardioides sp. CFH 31398]MCH1867206.1 MarR family winged helix-turn-helix transcriptional regulator [Nocardioides sp. CFH 31398]
MEVGGQSATEPAWLDAGQQRSWRALVLGMTLLTHRLDDELRRGFGLSLTEYEILVRLSESPNREMRMAALADSLCLSRSRITHTVARMEAAGLVERRASQLDGRGVVAVMTDGGAAKLRAASPSHVAAVREHLVDLVEPSDFDAMGRVMNAVSDDLVRQNPDAEIR